MSIRYIAIMNSSFIMLAHCPIIVAICGDGFCMNGGNCLYPDVNCSCPDNWSVNQCQCTGGNCSYLNVNCSCWSGNQCGTGII